jgi:hypothetical protein
MKHIQTFVSVAICGLVLTLGGGVYAESTHPGVATVVRIAGEARYSLGDGVWHPLVAGKILEAGAVIQTGHDGTVDIILGKKILMPQANPLPDRVSLATDEKVRDYVSYRPYAEQNAIRMTGDTVLAIDKLTVSDSGVDTISDTELDLRQGGIYNSVKKLSGPSQYLIKIPNGIAGVRGTMFYIDVTGKCFVFPNKDNHSGTQSSLVMSLTVGPNGTPFTVVVPEGDQFDPNNMGNSQTSPMSSGVTPLTPGVTPMPSELIDQLDQIFAALRTIYYGEVNYTYDKTEIPLSPTTGYSQNKNHTGFWSWW